MTFLAILISLFAERFLGSMEDLRRYEGFLAFVRWVRDRLPTGGPWDGALGVVLVVAEVLTPTLGALGISGVAAFTVGSIMLFHSDVPGFSVNEGVIAGLALSAIITLGGVIWLLMRARRARVFSGDAQLVDHRGQLLEPLPAGGEAWARINGERWRVRSNSGDPLPDGARVRARKRDGLVLWVDAE